MRFALFILFIAGSTTVLAQDDVGVVNLVSGEVTYAAQGGAPAKVSPFMRVREGDRFDLASGSQLRVVYVHGGRQERWQGPASFVAGVQEGKAQKGKPAEVTQLPATVPLRIARVPQLMQNARLGGVGLRAMRSDRTAMDDVIIQDARATYQTLRRELPADDLTPELYLYATLDEYRLYDEMRPVVDEMLRKQPQNQEIQALAAFVKTRTGR
ncbi:MAG: hypothetical protein QOD26_326 [Betaproteobacteria bacterium]|jgi:hypothetical protein|nr:hypothetical protein [Betaproteobacteria bacterium]